MLSRSQIVQRLHSLTDFHLTHYICRNIDGSHLATLRLKSTSQLLPDYLATDYLCKVVEEFNSLLITSINSHPNQFKLRYEFAGGL